MWSLAWPWALIALPLPWIARALLPEARGLLQAGLMLFDGIGDQYVFQSTAFLTDFQFAVAVGFFKPQLQISMKIMLGGIAEVQFL